MKQDPPAVFRGAARAGRAQRGDARHERREPRRTLRAGARRARLHAAARDAARRRQRRVLRLGRAALERRPRRLHSARSRGADAGVFLQHHAARHGRVPRRAGRSVVRRLRELRGLGARPQRGPPGARGSSTRRSRRSRSAKASASSPRRSRSTACAARPACTASATSRSAKWRCGSASARRIAARRSPRAATSSTRSSTACRSGRRSITSTATRAGSTASAAREPSAHAPRARCTAHSRPRHHMDTHDAAARCRSRVRAATTRARWPCPRSGAEGQAEAAARGSVLVIGAGGLGVPVLQYLAAAGVGRVGIADGDVVEASNLHRQPLYGAGGHRRREGRGGRATAALAEPATCRSSVHAERASAANIADWLAQYDLVVDCSDNFATKFLVNDAAVSLGKPAVFASVYQYEGPAADLPAARRLAVPALPVARGPARRPRRQLRRGGRARRRARDARRDAGDAGAQDPARAAGRSAPGPAHVRPARHALAHAQGRAQSGVRPRRAARCCRTRAVDARECSNCASRRCARRGHSGLTLVDIREGLGTRRRRARASSIELHVPLSAFVEGATALPADGRYLVVCAHGVRSLALAEHLRAHGYAEVYSLAGGLAALGTVTSGQCQCLVGAPTRR